MSLSFREHAAIEYACKRDTGASADGSVFGGWVYSDAEAVEAAQNLANECCKQWGHDGFVLDGEGNRVCPRCGERIDK